MQGCVSVRTTSPPVTVWTAVERSSSRRSSICYQPPRVLPMAATAISLHLRPNRHRLLRNPNFISFFSSSSSPDDTTSPPPPQSQSQSESRSSFSSYFNDVKASLKQTPPPQQPPRRSFSPSFTNASSSKSDSLDEVRRNLSEFRRRTNAPPPNSSTQQPVSFQELYMRNVPGKGDPNEPGKPVLRPIEAIKQSLNQRKSSVQNQGEGPRMSIDRLKESFNWQSGTENSGTFIKSPSFLGNEIGDTKPMSDSMSMNFVRTYNHKDMGTKLTKLRPEVKGKNWFSLTELNERLKKLRAIEETESGSKMGGAYNDLKHSLAKISTDDDKPKKGTIRKLDVLGQLGGTPDFMLLPPQEPLVEKYFHPDNMSSGEKLKIELKKVRDEFKMSESDCGSARVVVAQLTTKIKHLSSVLHKKDKHSRKGLVGMVQQRKKLLKYLRRTDWDSYCFVLSKLGLRDNPDYKS